MKPKNKAAIIITGIIIGILLAGILLVFLKKKHVNESVPPVILTNYITDSQGKVIGGNIHLYSEGKLENIGDIALSNASKKDENTLVGIQNLYPDAERFQGIITYNYRAEDIEEIISCDAIREFLDVPALDFHGSVQMNELGNHLYFLCNGKLILYNLESKELELILETSGYQYVIDQEERVIWFSENQTLFEYDRMNQSRRLIMEGVNNFAVSKDGEMIVYERRDLKRLFLYTVDTGEDQELIDLSYGDSQLSISVDNQSVLYTDYKESAIPSNRKLRVYIYELQTGDNRMIYEGEYTDNIRSVIWYNEPSGGSALARETTFGECHVIRVGGAVASYEYIDRNLDLNYFYELKADTTYEDIVGAIGKPNGGMGSGIIYSYYEVGEQYVVMDFTLDDQGDWDKLKRMSLYSSTSYIEDIPLK